VEHATKQLSRSRLVRLAYALGVPELARAALEVLSLLRSDGQLDAAGKVKLKRLVVAQLAQQLLEPLDGAGLVPSARGVEPTARRP
jgi:hypothetical protein